MDELQNITESSNNTKHRSIKMTPKEGQESDQFILWKNQYDEMPKRQSIEDTNKFQSKKNKKNI